MPFALCHFLSDQTATHFNKRCLETDFTGVFDRSLEGIGKGVDAGIDGPFFHLSLPGVGRPYAAHSNRGGGIEDACNG